ncbi:DNA-3-methyladenine glycosylase [Frankia sp. AgB1.9]|uniref:DNA-3-methyladenine glycosylase n=2 Tax=Frankia TaxID=1854 RepID=UPI0019326EA0|nr:MULTISPECIES: DNA-3-methyladenine glycosylase [unclassified Frankia]MBL7549129.1 DNA-3-methyladenine glycosylase [Frankia sp. AgB1.9]MBL7617952.1 DNA-3-methyladenine glycosylase [Frankia sp. AgB1.8]
MPDPGSPAAPAPLPANFYARPVLAVARDLLGATVRHGPVCVRLTEVEAYTGPDDPASHAARGPTPRSAVMFGPPGHAYVYFVYGMHWCLNIVCGPAGTPSAVLVRAGEVVAGVDLARARAPRLVDRDLARGPGRLARTLGADGSLTGSPVIGGGPLVVERGTQVDDTQVCTGPRIGLRVAVERPWRFWVAGDPTVSATKGRTAPVTRVGPDLQWAGPALGPADQPPIPDEIV